MTGDDASSSKRRSSDLQGPRAAFGQRGEANPAYAYPRPKKRTVERKYDQLTARSRIRRREICAFCFSALLVTRGDAGNCSTLARVDKDHVD
jgi:hypothetical protein